MLVQLSTPALCSYPRVHSPLPFWHSTTPPPSSPASRSARCSHHHPPPRPPLTYTAPHHHLEPGHRRIPQPPPTTSLALPQHVGCLPLGVVHPFQGVTAHAHRRLSGHHLVHVCRVHLPSPFTGGVTPVRNQLATCERRFLRGAALLISSSFFQLVLPCFTSVCAIA
jgi:hypothetical protein